MARKSILLDIFLVLGVIIMIVLLFHKDNQISKADSKIRNYTDSIYLLNQFRAEVLNTFVPENFVESKDLNNIKLKDRSGQEFFLKDHISEDPLLIMAFNNDCLSCLDKHLSALDEPFRGILICGFQTYRQFISFDNPFLSKSKSYFINQTDYQDIFGIHEGILTFLYQKRSGSSASYIHKYEKRDLSNRYFSILEQYIEKNNTLTFKN